MSLRPWQDREDWHGVPPAPVTRFRDFSHGDGVETANTPNGEVTRPPEGESDAGRIAARLAFPRPAPSIPGADGSPRQHDYRRSAAAGPALYVTGPDRTRAGRVNGESTARADPEAATGSAPGAPGSQERQEHLTACRAELSLFGPGADGRAGSPRTDAVTDSGRPGDGSTEQTAGTMPDSPADVKTQPRSTPPAMPPPPPAVSQAANRSASFTPTTTRRQKTRLPKMGQKRQKLSVL
ncbi:hypothetical protein COCON_G00219900 [Conger conger]|uniref:Uncharacterized protein n=1 Tax=Conger conger TaxID=82655 RepID=A0A9Q1HPR8_CONCO|nr:hypothetical protein COCON_G00219900 [Conger conger]